jgi:hypothetical protein
MQHTVQVVSEVELFDDEGAIIRADYIMILCYPELNCRTEFDDFASRLSEHGFLPVVIEDHAVLLRATNAE